MPPSVSRSVASRVTPSASSASSTAVTSACSTLGRAPRALLARTVSVPENRTNAMVATRCSGSGGPGARYSPRAAGNRVAIRCPRPAGTGCRAAGRGVRPPAPQQQRAVVARAGAAGGQPGRGGRADDDLPGVGGLLGEGRRSARRGRAPAARGWASRRGRARCHRRARPTDIDSEKRPADVGTAAAARSEARISTAASQACSGWSSPRKRKSRASPPNLSSSPPRVAAMREHRARTPG